MVQQITITCDWSAMKISNGVNKKRVFLIGMDFSYEINLNRLYTELKVKSFFHFNKLHFKSWLNNFVAKQF